MPSAFRCSEKPPPAPLSPIQIPGMDGIMSNDGVAVVFNLDPRLQESKHSKHHKMAPREGGFLGSLRASFSSKSLRIDNKLDSRSIPHSKSDKWRREKGKEKERDLSFVTLPRSASSLIPGKPSNIVTSMSHPPPIPRREDRLPKHSNIFTGFPTPTDSAVTSARNSQHALSKPSTPVYDHPLRSSRSVPDWTSEQRRQYCYLQDACEDQLPRMPSADGPQPASNPKITTEEVETLGSQNRSEIQRDNSSKLPSISRYKKQKNATPNGDAGFHQPRSSLKPQKSPYLCENDGTQVNETPSPFLGTDDPGNGMNATTIPIRKLPQQQRPDHIPNPQTMLPRPQHQIRRRSTAPASVTDEDQRRTLSTSQPRPDRLTSTSTYQAHRGHPLYPVVEETPPSLPLPKWRGDWSPHLQQGSELFLEAGMGMDLCGSGLVASGTTPVAEMGIPSPPAKTRPASWTYPTRITVGTGLDLAKPSISRHSHELDILFPPTPPSSTGDVWDDSHIDLDITARERKFFWDMLKHSWNVFVLIWALLLIFKSVQFVVRAIELVVFEPVKIFYQVLRNVAEG